MERSLWSGSRRKIIALLEEYRRNDPHQSDDRDKSRRGVVGAVRSAGRARLSGHGDPRVLVSAALSSGVVTFFGTPLRVQPRSILGLCHGFILPALNWRLAQWPAPSLARSAAAEGSAAAPRVAIFRGHRSADPRRKSTRRGRTVPAPADGGHHGAWRDGPHSR